MVRNSFKNSFRECAEEAGALGREGFYYFYGYAIQSPLESDKVEVPKNEPIEKTSLHNVDNDNEETCFNLIV